MMDKVHEGHRERLRSRALSSEMDALKPHEVLEYLLFFAIPRQNINPLAHVLLNRFGSLRGVFTAELSELKQVQGISDTTARWLQNVGAAVLHYTQTERESIRLRTRLNARRFLRQFREQGSWVICMSESGRILRIVPMDEGDDWCTAAAVQRVIREILLCHATNVLMVHRRNRLKFLPEEKQRSDALSSSLNGLGIIVLEHIFITPDGERVAYASWKTPKEQGLAESSELLEHWLDEDEEE